MALLDNEITELNDATKNQQHPMQTIDDVKAALVATIRPLLEYGRTLDVYTVVTKYDLEEQPPPGNEYHPKPHFTTLLLTYLADWFDANVRHSDVIRRRMAVLYSLAAGATNLLETIRGAAMRLLERTAQLTTELAARQTQMFAKRAGALIKQASPGVAMHSAQPGVPEYPIAELVKVLKRDLLDADNKQHSESRGGSDCFDQFLFKLQDNGPVVGNSPESSSRDAVQAAMRDVKHELLRQMVCGVEI